MPRAYGVSLAMLTTVYVLNFVDRQIVTILAEPIKHAFGLADWQLGAVTGLSFAVLYTVAGFPLARLADHADRPRIIAAAVLLWSVFTVLCGVAQGFGQFVAARIGVGLGEAGCTPPAQSLIADLVPAGRRAGALALYAMGAPLGQLIGMAVGGLVAARWGWRSAFLVAAAPGVGLAVIALATIREPRRRMSASAAPAVALAPAIRALLASRSFVLVATGGGAAAFVFYGLGAFYASFFLRNHAAELARAAASAGVAPLAFLGVALGASGGLAGVAGAIAGGRATDAWARHGAGHVLMPAACTVAAAPVLLAALLVPSLGAAIGLIAVAAACNAAWVGGAYAAVLGLVAPSSRATASALMMFFVNVIGLGLGPLTVGLLSDAFATALGPGEGLRWGMACATIAGLVASGLFWTARTSLARDTVG